MRDPERWLRRPPSGLARVLLQRGAEEKPSARARRRTAEAVAAAVGAVATSATATAAATAAKLTTEAGVRALAGGAAATGGSAASTGAAAGLGVLVKWFAVGALGGVLSVPVMRAVAPAQRTNAVEPLRPPATARPSTHPLHPSANPTSTPVIASAAAQASASQKSGAPGVQSADVSRGASRRAETPAPVDNAPTSAPPAARDAPILAAEVRFVEQGRAALQRGAFLEALALLAPYETRFSEPQLLTEVLFLRMEAYSRSGDVSRARALAARIVSRDVAGPQAARAHEVLER
jgi:hypothetical protein